MKLIQDMSANFSSNDNLKKEQNLRSHLVNFTNRNHSSLQSEVYTLSGDGNEIAPRWQWQQSLVFNGAIFFTLKEVKQTFENTSAYSTVNVIPEPGHSVHFIPISSQDRYVKISVM